LADYETKLETLAVGGLDTRIRSLKDRQQFCDTDGLAARAGISSASWPLFGLIWPSALILATYLQTFPFGRRRILEVGCGLALGSLVAHRHHASITASDYHPLTESFLRENLRLNELPPLPYCRSDWGGDNLLLGRFDVIIGSDVLYERDQPARLAAFIAAHAEATAEIVIVDPDRGNRPAFNRHMGQLGFAYTEIRLRVLPGTAHPFKGRILNYRRAARPPGLSCGPSEPWHRR
jgi:predicted nicotinamide N-methyase